MSVDELLMCKRLKEEVHVLKNSLCGAQKQGGALDWLGPCSKMGQKTKGGKAKGKSLANENVHKEVKEQVVETQGPSVDDLFVLLDRHVRADDLKNIVKVADQSILASL